MAYPVSTCHISSRHGPPWHILLRRDIAKVNISIFRGECMHSSPADWPEELSPHQVYNLVSSGKMLKISQTGGSGSLGVTLPKDEMRKRGIKAGDAVLLLPTDDPDTFELHFPPQE